MTRSVFCQYLQKEEEGLAAAPYPGELGERIFNHISKQAWQAWQSKQIMLINENKLNMMDIEHRQRLEREMIAFLFEGKEIQIKGYIQPN